MIFSVADLTLCLYANSQSSLNCVGVLPDARLNLARQLTIRPALRWRIAHCMADRIPN
jgi:hypothetical protein